ncbi:uncharacterized protein LOC118647783 [Monomorium pharaonis]|uniref:uncharacterized protein LOC118647783 n=1 Tax=Monomorium pharaonis TaxID=307658 RepID=UPI001745FADB|nr:uncharacterized protein LOC118647783 [Monomorium pharaonis]
MENDILNEISRFLEEVEPYDPANLGMRNIGDRPPVTSKPGPSDDKDPGPSPTEEQAIHPPRHNIPVVGCVSGHWVQPSDQVHKRKMEWLCNPPTVKSKSRKLPPRTEPSRPSLEPAGVMEPLPALSTPVEVEPGHLIEVPHFAIHSTREWKTRSRGSGGTSALTKTGPFEKSVSEIPKMLCLRIQAQKGGNQK